MAPKDKSSEDKKKKVAAADKPDKKEKKPKDKDKDPEKKKLSSKDKPAGKDGASKSTKSKGEASDPSPWLKTQERRQTLRQRKRAGSIPRTARHDFSSTWMIGKPL